MNFYLIIYVCVVSIICSATAIREPEKKGNGTYCYRFSWLGPRFKKDSQLGENNLTCSDLLGTSTNVPCRQPLAITEDGSLPDMEYVWNTYEKDVRCELIEGEVCAKYSYIYSGTIQNITYFCAKAYIEGEGAIESKACFRQVDGDRVVEVCLCKTLHGSKYPCNASNTLNVNNVLGTIVIALLALRMHF